MIHSDFKTEIIIVIINFTRLKERMLNKKSSTEI